MVAVFPFKNIIFHLPVRIMFIIMKKAIIFDLDNTIYSAPSIGGEVFASLLLLIEKDEEQKENMQVIKHDIMRKPFQIIAASYQFSDELTNKGIDLLQTLTYEGIIEPFEDFEETKNLTQDKYLVTTGFPLLQQSKIKGLQLENEFKEIHIVDPSASSKTKKDVFADIIQRHAYQPSDVLVIGDDPASEIKAALALGIDAVLYDKFGWHPESSLPKINHYSQLANFIQ